MLATGLGDNLIYNITLKPAASFFHSNTDSIGWVNPSANVVRSLEKKLRQNFF